MRSCALILILVPVAAGCSTGDPAARIDPVGPERGSFEPVARVLAARCGMLDCHGSVYRNLRLYGFGGLRLGAGAPDQGDIRPEEVTANYEAAIALEPEAMRAVVRDRGAAPERLTLIRKARGAEEHAGNAAIQPGDDADRCLVSWLASSVDVPACLAAAPPRDAGPPDAR